MIAYHALYALHINLERIGWRGWDSTSTRYACAFDQGANNAYRAFP